MKLLEVNWPAFVEALDLYRRMPVEARRFFVDHIKPSQPATKGFLGQWRAPLVESGLLAMSSNGMNASVRPEYREFSRAIRAIARSRIFEGASRESFQAYVSENLTNRQAAGLGGSSMFGHFDYQGMQRLYSQVCSAAWAREFLEADSTDWELEYEADDQEREYIETPAALAATQAMVRAVATEGGPVPIARLAEICPKEFGPSLMAALRYLLLFPGLRAGDLEPVVGLWPKAAGRIAGGPGEPPQPVEVKDTFHSAFLPDDMLAVLSACTVEPIRLRSGDRNIFEAAQRNLAASLGTLPAWVQDSFRLPPDVRISGAIYFLRLFRYVRDGGKPGADFRMEAAEAGAAWLAMPFKARLRTLMDRLRGAGKREDSLFEYESAALVPGLHGMGRPGDAAKLAPDVLRAFADAPAGKFVRLADFLTFHAFRTNGLKALVKQQRYFSMYIAGRYLNAPSEGEVEEVWAQLLYMFLIERLLPLGGVKLGVMEGENAICFAVTDAGRYLLGKAADFEIAAGETAHIVIQPNFDVVFLAPSASAEAELARFCERKGRHMGTLFRITKSSILAGAATGLNSDQALAILKAHAASGVPANVESEIKGWFGRYREVSVKPAVIMHCSDAETAARVMAAMGKKVTQLNETTLELHEAKIQPAVAKKLREAGIFVRS